MYFAWWKLLLIWLLFLAWIKTTDWVNKDAQILSLNHLFWNPIAFLPFLLVLLAITLTVIFPIGFSALLLAWVVPLGAYVFHRNSNVEDYQKVLTADHFRHLLSGATGVKTEKKAAHEKGAPVELKAISGESNARNEANLILARQSEGYVGTKDLLADAIDRRSSKLMFDTDAEQVSIRYQIDGVWHEADPMDREAGDATIEVLKRLCAANPEERRKRQSGELELKYNGEKCRGVLVSQGTKTGERTILSLVEGRARVRLDGSSRYAFEAAGANEGIARLAKRHPAFQFHSRWWTFNERGAGRQDGRPVHARLYVFPGCE